MSCSLSTSERYGLNGRKASDWLRLYTPNWAVSDFEGGVRLTSSDGRDHFEPFWFLIPSKLEGSEAQLTEKQAVLLCEFHTFPVTEDNEILHLHFSS